MATNNMKKLNFFKKETAPPKTKKNNRSALSEKKEVTLIKKIISSPYFYFAIFTILISLLSSYKPSHSLPIFEEGEIASSNVTAPADMTVEDTETTENRKNEAAATVLPVYTLDENVFLNTEDKIRDFFNSGREMMNQGVAASRTQDFQIDIQEKYSIEVPKDIIRALAQEGFSSELEDSLINVIKNCSEIGIIASKNLFTHNEQDQGFTLLTSTGQEQKIQASDILDLNECREKLSEDISAMDITSRKKSLLESLSHLFIEENITYNPIETELRKVNARSSVETVFYNIKKGKVILRRGDEANEDAISQIEAINQNLSDKPSWLTNFLGSFLLFGILFLALIFYFDSKKNKEGSLNKYTVTGVLALLSLVIYKLSIFMVGLISQYSNVPLLEYPQSLNYALPFQLGSILFTYLLGIHMGLIFTLLNSVIVGHLFKANFYLMIFTMLGGVAAVVGTKRYGKSMISAFKSGVFLVAPINTLVIIIFHLLRESIGPLNLISSEILMGILGGVLSGALAFVFIPLFENTFAILTPSRLNDLTNSDLPIFRKMAMEAPGTYHHSLIVSSLAENAAEEIKLNPLVVRAGAMYHDIGKIKRPEYFIENRTRKINRHEDLKPSMSSLVIINHVKEGVEKANKLKLPKKIKEIIAQHHGDSLMRYFYEKAKQEYDPEMHKVGEESYRYLGPKPKTKEAALVMLADSVEAASRSLEKPTEDNLKRLINDIFNNYLLDGQLDNSDLSLKELLTIASSFLSTLDTVYHPRIEYPGFNFEKAPPKKSKKPKKSSSQNDRRSQSTK
ncbi:MAG: HDIG domain-containing protein [Candidatus Aminicenantes bacterium]|nr:HDIG domain-containing protein [Candidatus Aminicenantes bacterium]